MPLERPVGLTHALSWSRSVIRYASLSDSSLVHHRSCGSCTSRDDGCCARTLYSEPDFGERIRPGDHNASHLADRLLLGPTFQSKRASCSRSSVDFGGGLVSGLPDCARPSRRRGLSRLGG